MNENVTTHRSRVYILQIQPPEDTGLSYPTTNSQAIWLCLDDMPSHAYISMNDEEQDRQNGYWVNRSH